jgi:GeoRSP system SPASM domain protein
MTIDLLDTPVRVTWDLHQGQPPLTSAEAERLTQALVEGGVFFVTLENGALLYPNIENILVTLAGGGCRTLLVLSSKAEIAALAADLPLHGVFIDATPHLEGAVADFASLAEAVDAVRDRGFRQPAVSVLPTRRTLPLLPALAAFCKEYGIARCKLPNTPFRRLADPLASATLPAAADLTAWRSLIADFAWPAEVALEIHDLFLWEMLVHTQQHTRSEYGGCQAANSIAHLQGAGEVHPCSSWSESLGNLLNDSLDTIWQGPGRMRLRQTIAAVPAGCSGCRDYAGCFGGCRGLAQLLHSSGGRDPLCAGLRPPGGAP